MAASLTAEQQAIVNLQQELETMQGFDVVELRVVERHFRQEAGVPPRDLPQQVLLEGLDGAPQCV